MPRFKLCTFDVTNTLLKFHTPVGHQYAKIGRIYGVERDPDQISKSFSHQWKIMNLKFPNYGKTIGLSAYEWWKEVVRRSFIVDSAELSENQLNSISCHLYDMYKGDTCWKVESGAEVLLRNLKKEKVILGVISNFDERLNSVLKSNGLKSYFDFILASYVVEAAKPNRKIFDLALQHCNYITASQALHVGDNIMLDYLAAKDAGWNALLLAKPNTNDEIPKPVDPNEVVYNMQEIETYILCS